MLPLFVHADGGGGTDRAEQLEDSSVTYMLLIDWESAFSLQRSIVSTLKRQSFPTLNAGNLARFKNSIDRAWVNVKIIRHFLYR
jgi:hypothetical protein